MIFCSLGQKWFWSHAIFTGFTQKMVKI